MTVQDSHNSIFQNDLTTYEVSAEDLPEIVQICSIWANSTELRMLQTTDETKKQRLVDSEKILRQIACCAYNVFVTQSRDPIVFHKAIDQHGKPQSISCSWIDNTEITIMCLATNPVNILCLPFEGVCRGAGREIVFCCIRKVIQLGISEIKLRSLPLARSFYTKLGFEIYEHSDGMKLDRMRLTAEIIWNLYPHFIIPGIAA